MLGTNTPAPPTVTIAVPAVDWVWTKAALGLIGVVLNSGARLHLMMQTSGTTIARKRNECVARFLATDDEWLFFLDSDMEPPPNIIPRLLARDKDVIAGLAFARVHPFPPAAGYIRDGEFAFLADLDPQNPVREVDWVGAACLLIRRRVLEQLTTRPDESWFEANEEDAGEDVAFCRKAKAAGFTVWVDTSVSVGHLGLTSISFESLISPPIITLVGRAAPPKAA